MSSTEVRESKEAGSRIALVCDARQDCSLQICEQGGGETNGEPEQNLVLPYHSKPVAWQGFPFLFSEKWHAPKKKWAVWWIPWVQVAWWKSIESRSVRCRGFWALYPSSHVPWWVPYWWTRGSILCECLFCVFLRCVCVCVCVCERTFFGDGSTRN